MPSKLTVTGSGDVELFQMVSSGDCLEVVSCSVVTLGERLCTDTVKVYWDTGLFEQAQSSSEDGLEGAGHWVLTQEQRFYVITVEVSWDVGHFELVE